MSVEVKFWWDEVIYYYLLIVIWVLFVYFILNFFCNDYVDKKGCFYFKNCNSGCIFVDIYIEFIIISILLFNFKVYK